MNKRTEVIKYIVSDYITSGIAWLLFFIFRKQFIEYPFEITWDIATSNQKFWFGVFFIPIGWILLYGIQGLYHNVYRKSRLKEFTQVFFSCIIGCLVLFFLFVLDDINHNKYTAYYKSIGFLFAAQFLLNGVFRYLITTYSARKIHKGTIGFNTLIIGDNAKAKKLYLELKNAKKSAGYKIIGF